MILDENSNPISLDTVETKQALVENNNQEQKEDIREMQFSISEEDKNQLKIARLYEMMDELEQTYNTDINKLIVVSVKYKEILDKQTDTKTKDTYYSSKLKKNNEKIFDMLSQYENSKNLLISKIQILQQESNNASSQTI